MSENNSGEQAVATDAGASTDAERGAGNMLREAREAAGIELSALALALKVSIKKLEALENDRYAELPDAVFTRALASSICRTFKLDPGPVLARLPQAGASRLKPQDEDALNAPFRTPDEVAKTPFFDRLSRPMVLGALAVLLGALVVIFFPEIERREEPVAADASSAKPLPESAEYPAQKEPEAEAASEQKEKAEAEAETAPTVSTARTPASTPSIVVAPVKPKPAVQTASSQAMPASSVAAALAAPPVAAPAKPSTPPEEEDEDPKAKFARNGVVVFKMKERGFVQVIDASETVRISRVLDAGDQVGIVNGPFPLRVTVGRPEVTEVQVRGKPFDLAPVIANGQAKFEVN